jgi:hypothetical protein
VLDQQERDQINLGGDSMTAVSQPDSGYTPASTSGFYDWSGDDWREPGTGDVALAESLAIQADDAVDNAELLARLEELASDVYRAMARFLEAMESGTPLPVSSFGGAGTVPPARTAVDDDDGDDEDDAAELAGMLAANGGR